ncbi:hypothetical protein AC579_1197 [Pseudocercospora musae]|uniref:Uncharacterized protein n=1 Tax=Pseudocercospora musae TaxID=113226 RepID=A0A139I6S1_9PEZI|nr:hypothetical protein AC579_1197 [Pseudocercospora musae]
MASKFLLANFVTTLTAIGASTYFLHSQVLTNLEEQEARFDELEGTMRGHIGLIEEALDRLEAKVGTAGRGPGGLENREMYEKRGKDDRKK